MVALFCITLMSFVFYGLWAFTRDFYKATKGNKPKSKLRK